MFQSNNHFTHAQRCHTAALSLYSIKQYDQIESRLKIQMSYQHLHFQEPEKALNLLAQLIKQSSLDASQMQTIIQQYIKVYQVIYIIL